MSDVLDPALEQAIARDPDDRAAFVVYADWLQQAGNPRGELAAIQLARETADTPAMQAREDALLEEHADVLCGPPLADGYRIPDHCNEVTYRGGFWRSIVFSGPPHVLAALVAHPSARLLHRLAIASLDGAEDDYTPAIEILSSARLPVLRELRIGDLPEGQSALAGFADRTCGSLAALVLQGYQIYTERQRARIGAGGNCPTTGCGLPASSINKYSGRWECERGHSWK